MLSASARQPATRAMSSGCVASHASTAARRSAGSSPSTWAWSSSSVTGTSGSVIVPPRSFDATERRALTVEKSLDLRPGARQPRHHGPDRDALHLGDLAVGQALEDDQQQRRALVLDEARQRPLDVAR